MVFQFYKVKFTMRDIIIKVEAEDEDTAVTLAGSSINEYLDDAVEDVDVTPIEITETEDYD